MKKYFALILPLIAGFAMTSCKKSFDSLNQNENKPLSVPAYLLLNGIVNDMYDRPYSDYEKWDQYYIINYD
ncbi:MAG TPA: hypothetical protein VNS32_06625, partial [Flavisolibacter sp.]|nr:hypothetical protein [Flavisolibacter sp.]